MRSALHSSSQGELDTRWPAQAGWLRDWPDMHWGAIYCSLGLTAASLTRLSRLAAGLQFAVKMRLRDFLKIVEIPTLVVSNICKMALASNIGCRVIDGL